MLKACLRALGIGRKIKKEIVINVERLETRAAVLDDGALEELFIERFDEERVVGSVFKGKIQNVEDGLQAAFIDIGLKKNAFVHYWDMIPEDATRLEAEEGVQISRPGRQKKTEPGVMAKRFPIGSEIIVQVTKGAIGTKGPRVTANLSIPGRYLVMMPGSNLKGVSRKIENEEERKRLKKILARLPIPQGIGVIVRTAGEGARAVSFVRDLRALLATWQDVETAIREEPAPCCVFREPDLIERVVRDSLTDEIDRIVLDAREDYERIKALTAKISRRAKGRVKLYDGAAPIFEHFQVEGQIENAFRRKVWLKSGGYIIFDETEALVAVDVNTGRHKGGSSQEESILQVNLEAADEVARQLRLRNIGGLIVIDFIDMRQRKNQNAVFKALKTALQGDKARTNVLPVSSLGLVEMTRQRVEESFHASAYMDCPYCRGRGKVLSAVSMSVEIQRRIAEVMRKHAHQEPLPIKIHVAPAVMERLRKEDEQALIEIERRYSGKLTFVVDAGLHVEDFNIHNTETGGLLYTSKD